MKRLFISIIKSCLSHDRALNIMILKIVELTLDLNKFIKNFSLLFCYLSHPLF